jgi:methylated-DNA-[protein]-cysteine S-methyltransferase
MTDPVQTLLFETPVGRCGLAWSPAGLVAVRLPEDDPARLAAWAGRLGPAADEPPPWILVLVERIRRLMAGGTELFGDVPLDLRGVSDFEVQVYRHILELAPGRTTTYGAIARALGDPGAARAVGRALGRNPVPVVVPCHRVLAAGAGLGGFSAPGGRDTKLKLLALEGLDLRPGPDLFGDGRA